MNFVKNIQHVQISIDGDRVLLLKDGVLILDLNYEQAQAVAKAIKIQADKVEEIKNAGAIIKDQAILTRAGFLVGLSDHPDIKKEALKEAQHNRDLRRFIPNAKFGNIKSREAFGTPSIIKK